MRDASAQPHSPVVELETFLTNLWDQNPVFVHLLGMCPVLAVSNSVVNSVSMGLASTFVLVMSAIVVSLVRHLVPSKIRIPTFIVVIATFVTVAGQVLQAISLEIHAALGAYVPLIVVNCMILGRMEAFASKKSLLPSVLDAAGTGVGFTFAIFMMGAVREVLGSGSFLGTPLFGSNFEPWVIMILPGGGFFVLGLLLLVFLWIDQRMRKEEAR